MVPITLRPIEDQAVWDAFLATRPEANFLQSWQWGQFHEALGQAIFRRGFFRDEELVGVMLSVVERARRGTYLTVPGGPIIDWHNQDLTKAFVAEVKAQAHSASCAFVRVRSQLLSDDFSIGLFQQLGFRSAPIHLHAELTNQLDLSKTEDELRSAMRKGTRYELRQAEKEGIAVASSTDQTELKPFYDLQIETSKRQGFVPFSFNFLAKQFEIFTASDQALLYSARLDDQMLAQAFIIFYGQEAVYHYGASTEAGRQHPGAYAVQWQAILEAKRRGLARYNFYGVAPTDQPKHRFWGVSIFKRGFGGEDVAYLHAQDLVINWPRYSLNLVVEAARKRVRRV